MVNFSSAYPGGGGAFFGNPPPKPIVGNFYRPYPYSLMTATASTTDQMQFFLMLVTPNHAYQGAAIFNTGTSDSGKQARLMMFNDDMTNGGPGTLAKDFGLVTCNATARLLIASSSWTPTQSLYWGAVWTGASITLNNMVPYVSVTQAAWSADQQPAHFIGDPTGILITSASLAAAFYGSLSFGAAPSNAPAITGLVTVNPGAISFGGAAGFLCPDFQLQA